MSSKEEFEKERLKELDSYSILDTLPEKEYDALTYIASLICGTPVAQIVIVDKDRQWYKSNYGVEMEEVPRTVGFCSHTIKTPEEALVVNDLRLDDRFADNPFVKGEPHVKFYAGVPLVTKNGYPLGSICVSDTEVRDITQEQLKALEGLSLQVVELLELRKRNYKLEKAVNFISEQNSFLKNHLNEIIDSTDQSLDSMNHFCKIYQKFYSKNFDERASIIFEEIENVSKSWKDSVSQMKSEEKGS